MSTDWLNVADVTPRIAYTATGGQTVFTVPFVFFENADLLVYKNAVLLTLTTQYTVTGAEVTSGGAVTLLTGATVGDVIMIVREVAIEQTAHIPPSGPLDIPAVNIQISKLIAIDQQLKNDSVRSIHFPDNDPTLSGELLSPALRGNKLFGFDGNGAPIYPLGPTFVGSTDVGAAVVDSRATGAVTTFAGSVNIVITNGYTTPGDGGGARYKRGTGAGSFTDGGAVSWVPIFDGNLLNASVFGVKGDGTTDDTTALQAAVTAASGKVLLIKGICGVSAKINVSDNTTIIGNNNKLDGFKALGSSLVHFGLLYANNKTNIKIRNLRFTGNLIEPTPLQDSGAIKFELDTLAAADMVGFEVSNCYFENFRTTDWIWFVADVGSTFAMREIKVYNNEVNAVAGCATTNAISGVNGNVFVRVTGNTGGTIASEQAGSNVGQVSNIQFYNNSCVGLGLSGFFAAFANTREIVVTGNVTRNMGNNTLAADRSYTYLFYNSSTGTFPDPTNIVCNNNVGYGNHSQAIYFAGCCNFAAVGNSFGFTYPSGVEPTLPHGAAIAINGGIDGVIVGNTLTDGLGGIAYVGITDRASTVTIAGNTIRSSTNSSGTQVGYGILLNGSANNVASVTNIVGNTIVLTGTTASGISIVGGAGINYSRLNIADNTISATQLGINCTATVIGAAPHLSGNFYYGTLTLFGLNLDFGANAVYMANEIVDCTSQTAGGAVGVRLTGTNYVIDNLTISNGSNSNNAFSAVGAQGTLRNVTFPGWGNATTVVASSLGLAAPNWTAKIGATVENLGKALTGSGGYVTANQKYIVNQWVNVSGSTTWQEQRMLTGA